VAAVEGYWGEAGVDFVGVVFDEVEADFAGAEGDDLGHVYFGEL